MESLWEKLLFADRNVVGVLKEKDCPDNYPKRFYTWRPTTDNWYPNFPGDLVQLRVSHMTDGRWRVSIWGADDHGMAKDFDTKDEAEFVFRSLPVIITQQDLWDRGFVLA